MLKVSCGFIKRPLDGAGNQTANVVVRNMGQMVHNYKRGVKGQGCMTLKELG